MLHDLHNDSAEQWLLDAIESIPDQRIVVTPSQWAEQKRRLSNSVTPFPGPYRFDIAPFLREILDCLDVYSPIQEVAVRKGVQVMMTTGVLENAIGYYIEHVRYAPMMLLTADAEMAKIRMDQYVIPMLQDSELTHLIQSSDETNARKTGKTDKKLEWQGGGFLLPFGALNANKLRSFSIMVLMRDEIDAYPMIVGKDGDPLEVSEGRTNAFEFTRKIVDLSTPLIKGSSMIDRQFKRGDQRQYHVGCLSCGYPQPIRFDAKRLEGGARAGMLWETNGDRLVLESVRWACVNCGHEHINAHKTKLFHEDNAKWVPTADPVAPNVRSYDLSALYSPVGFTTWENVVQKWLAAWDTQHNRPRDLQLLQVFYNNYLGRSFERVGEKLEFRVVSRHRRAEYRLGEIPNEFSESFAGGRIGPCILSCDVHKNKLNVAVWGFTPGQRVFVLDYWILKGDAEDLENPETWGRLREIMETTRYEDHENGRSYGIAINLIDAGYNQDLVCQFCAEYEGGVFPIIGRDRPSKSQKFDEFRPWVSKLGVRGFAAIVDIYKDRWGLALRKNWNGTGQQPEGHFNAPVDLPDDAIRELTAEKRVVKVDATTKQEVGYEWKRPNNAPNELWDLLVYATLGLDILAWDLLVNQFERDFVDWTEFWELAEMNKLYYTDL